MKLLKSPDYAIKAKEIHSFHISKRRELEGWTLELSAEKLNISIGSLSEYLLIAKWLKTHEDEILRKCDSKRQVLAFIHTAERRNELGE